MITRNVGSKVTFYKVNYLVVEGRTKFSHTKDIIEKFEYKRECVGAIVYWYYNIDCRYFIVWIPLP